MKTLLLSIIALCFSILGYSQTELWGMTAGGGEFSSGVIFKTDIDGTNQSVEHNFFTNVGITTIYVKLCEASNGKFYGTARMDGSGSAGVLFEYDPVTEVYTKKIDFLGASNGKNPEGGLMEASDGLLYGMTSRGGADDVGVLYSYDPSTNTLVNLFDFDGNIGGQNGSLPYGTLVEAPNGRLYGLTSRGGANNAGVLFEYNPATSIFVKKVTFTGTNGSRPYGTLMEASDGKFYATTYQGGTSSLGTLFSYTAGATSVTKEIDFNGTVRGSYPIGNLVEAPNGRLYGTATAGGTNADGTLYEFRLSNGNFVKKMDFNSAVTGDTPSGSMIYATNGLFYGMTRTGGANDDGVLYSYDYVSNTFTHRFDFDTGPTGDRPSGALLESGGLFYGLTYTGGSMGGGTLFEFDPATDIYTKKVDLAASPFGSNPYGSLMQHSNNKLYGLSRIGGAANDGVIFEYDHATGNYTMLHEFGLGLDGQNPRGELVEAANGKLYGLTDRGGANGEGTLFEYDVATSTYTKLIDLDGTNGAHPKGSLLEASNGKLYGMTREGGVNDEGVIFEFVIATGIYTSLFDFDATVSGRWPSGSFIEASNGLLYGVTENGGTNYRGVIFDFNTSTDTYTKQYEFNTEHQPFGQLVEAANGNLYGLTLTGGANGGGALFEYVIATSAYTNKYDFDGFPYTNGANSYGSLIESSNGHLYGMTKLGGIYNDGVIFEWNLSTDTYTKKTEFNFTNGANPEYGRLLEVSIPCIPTSSSLTETACDSYTLNGTPYTITGIYTQTIPNTAGCDSTITLDLTINNSTSSSLTETACDSYTLNGTPYTTTGIYTQTIPNTAGCDSTITLDLTINNSTSSSLTETACDSYTLNGTPYTITGIYTQTIPNTAGCDSTITLDLTINNSSSSSLTETACDSYTLNGTPYTITGIYTQTIPNTAGCDSTITLDLTINNSTSSSLTETTCDSYTLNGTPYTITGIYTQTIPNTVGCDSTITLDLTINNSSSSSLTETACDSYTLNGTPYTITGIYTQTIPNTAGCDSTITLDLTINNSSSSSLTETACDSYTLNGTPYTSTGIYTQTIPNTAGCDSTITLDLTINNSSSSSLTETTCDSYTLNGTPYTSTGIYTQTIPNTAGCDSTITLDLTINNSSSSSLTETACDSYTLNGTPYTSTGIYTQTIPNTAGCDSTITLDLTINNSTSSSLTETACDSYTLNGTPYTITGIYTQTIPNTAGCDSTITLDLTINNSTSSSLTETACDSYTLNGTPYTITGIYTQTIPNSAGCDSTITLDLTINNSTSSSLTETACDSYTLNGTPYTITGIYTQTIPNAAGCDSTITLDLTIITVDNTTSETGSTITANENGATYQWIDCDNGNNPITNETSQSYSPLLAGSYAVEITNNGCTVTSNCVTIDFAEINEMNSLEILVYPNPTTGILTVDFGKSHNDITVKVLNTVGQIIMNKRFTSTNEVTLNIPGSPGMYILELLTDEGKFSRTNLIKR